MGRYGLIGRNISYSKSPYIHNTLGIDYEIIDVDEIDKVSFYDYDGLNITIPYKKDVLKHIRVSDISLKAVNTIVNKDGKLYGYNTDIDGAISLLNKVEDGEEKVFLVLGTGGASFAFCEALKSKGLKYYVSSRTGDINYSNVYEKCSNINAIINCTPIGKSEDDTLFINLEKFSNLEYVIDANYFPYRTKFIVEGERLGLKTINGIGMIIEQAVSAEKLWGLEPDANGIKELYKDFSKDRNIYLIGMPGSGKSTVCKMLGIRLNKKYYDSDLEIEKTYKEKPSEIVKRSEKEFRVKESKVIKKLPRNNSVISFGGGAILNRENIEIAKMNGIVIFIDRNITKLATKNRPLSMDLEKLYKERIDLYKEYSDYTIKNEKLEDTVERIVEIWRKG